MHIPQIKDDADSTDQELSPLVPMASAAGWYVGRVYYEEYMGGWLPFDRQSHYMDTEEEAIEHLKATAPDDYEAYLELNYRQAA